MIACLKSPAGESFSRDCILRQEEALSELDLTIDEWLSKLEYTENRRSRIRQKLLEHMAAALTLRPAQRSRVDALPDEHTPPRSPVKDNTSPKPSRNDIESIKVYADAELHALFSTIENEMEKMARSGDPY